MLMMWRLTRVFAAARETARAAALVRTEDIALEALAGSWLEEGIVEAELYPVGDTGIDAEVLNTARIAARGSSRSRSRNRTRTRPPKALVYRSIGARRSCARCKPCEDPGRERRPL